MLLDIRRITFRKLHSTETTVLSLFEDLYNSLDNEQPIQLKLLDLYFAFDTLIHVRKTKKHWNKYKTMEWFSNFIKYRNYSIKIKITTLHHIPSIMVFIKILSPLYSLYILFHYKQLWNIIHRLLINLYADNIELHATITNATKLQDCLNELQN